MKRGMSSLPFLFPKGGGRMARLTRAAINRLQHIRSGIPENYRVLFTDARVAHKGQRTPGDDEPVMDEELTIAGLERSSGGLPVPLLLRIEGAEQEVGTSEGTGWFCMARRKRTDVVAPQSS